MPQIAIRKIVNMNQVWIQAWLQRDRSYGRRWQSWRPRWYAGV